VIDRKCSGVNECSTKDSVGECKTGCKHSEDETASCIVDSCGRHSDNIDECLDIEECSFINSRCSNISECSIKDSDGECKSGCKHSESQIISSCEVDMCFFHSLTACVSFPGCVISNSSCTSIFGSCNVIYSSFDCFSFPYCDFFVSGRCKNKLLYDVVCEIVGEKMCLNTTDCIWDAVNGCVRKEEEAKSNDSFNVLVLVNISL
jgi:hypothetical protein